MKPAIGDCPDLESIAAYVDGRLSGRARARMMQHLASCEDCYFVFSEAAQTRPHPSTRVSFGLRWRTWFGRPKAMWPASVGAALATAASVWLLVHYDVPGRWQSSQPSELQALVAAVGSERMIEPRLTGGFAFGPLRGPVRAGTPLVETVSPDVRIAAARIEKEALAHRTPRTLKTLGIAYLVMGDIDRAMPVLEDAADQAGPDAQILSDLSAAYLARAARGNQPQDLAEALAAADRAVNADATLAEASFNRALALERLSHRDRARQAWLDYLKLDDRSQWAGEARVHLRALGDTPQSRAADDPKLQKRLAAARQYLP
jgi:tetratricopeptide (TPR) repeat protein